MVHVSRETPEQTHRRLRGVLGRATVTLYDAPYEFEEARAGDQWPDGALAEVRDDDCVSRLVPARPGGDAETFGVLKVHFPDGDDNSGFVGWLATNLKTELGTGVFVICGHNPRRGGIFDYWGFPWELRREVLAALRALGATLPA